MTREEWLNAFARAAAPHFAALGAPIPANVRISVGFPTGGSRSKKIIGQCIYAPSSADGHIEIFIHPVLGDAARIADVLTHELCHAALPAETAHGPAFRKLATGLGLEGKMTATVAGPGWREWAEPVLAELGPIPHGALDVAAVAAKKQTTRMLKLECSACGAVWRMSARWSDRVTACPCCAGPV